MIDVAAVRTVFGDLAPAVLGEDPPDLRPRCPICGALGRVERIEVPLLEDPWFTVPGRSRCPNEADAQHREARLHDLRRELGHRAPEPRPFLAPALEETRPGFLEQLYRLVRQLR